MTTLEGGTIGGPEFPLWIPNDDTPLIPLQALFNAAQQSVIDQLIALRTRFQSVQAFSDASVFDAASGWQTLSATVHVLGETYGYFVCQIKKTGSALSVPSSGNVNNPILGQLNARFVPESESGLTSGDAGRLLAGYVLSSGQVKLSAVNSGADVAVNDVLSLIGGFILANPVSST